jgi:hypothetical protein
MNGQVFSVRVIICQCFRQLLSEYVLGVLLRQRTKKLENFFPSQKVAGFRVIEVASSLTDMFLKTTREVIHLDTALEQEHLLPFSSKLAENR